MALTSTLFRFQVELSDIDRGVYESLDLRVACHPSEDAERMVMRVLARAIAHEEGLEFGRGLSHVDDPTLHKTSLSGQLETWIDVGIPGADRLHRASKRVDKLMIFTHKLEVALRKEWSSRSIHGAKDIELVRLDPEFVSNLAEDLPRSVTWYLTIQDGSLSVSVGEQSFDSVIQRSSLQDFLDA
jgi:uncharacterized protein YaeQ